ncbi:MAG: hypothetical protein J1F01_06095 [Oscillospiraceae bacterium]|nr:hypothetical protein [Oscillospiraceae bacterium]
MSNLRKVVAAVIFTAIALIGFQAAYADDISVIMDSVATSESEYVNFDAVKPLQIDNRTLVSARSMAEAAGMEVSWDQDTQTAILTLNPDAYSEKPIERYGADIISQINDFGLNLRPLSITVALRLYDNNAVIRFNFMEKDGDIVAIGKNYEMDVQATLVNDGTIVIPIRHSMEMLGLNVNWNQNELCAYVSIPNNPKPPTDVAIIVNHGEGEYSSSLPAPDDGGIHLQPPSNEGNPNIGIYLGRFKITHYCPCTICNGNGSGRTAWAGQIIPGQTIAVDPSIIPKLSWVYIDGYGYRRAEDSGSGINQYSIDIAVPSHALAYQLGVVYKDVYLVE